MQYSPVAGEQSFHGHHIMEYTEIGCFCFPTNKQTPSRLPNTVYLSCLSWFKSSNRSKQQEEDVDVKVWYLCIGIS